jgi:hypothetical protein
MVSFGKMLVVAGFFSGIAARRHAENGEVSLHQAHASGEAQSAHDDGPCARSCSVISSARYWELVKDPDPAALTREMDKRCLSPECKGCRRVDGGSHRSTKPDCTPVPAQAPETPEVPELTEGVKLPEDVTEEGAETVQPVDEGSSEPVPDAVSESLEALRLELTTMIKAMEACSMVGDVDCRNFLTHPSRMYKRYPNVPRSHVCQKHYMCKSNLPGDDEYVGPVANVGDCGAMRLQAEAVCVAIKTTPF